MPRVARMRYGSKIALGASAVLATWLAAIGFATLALGLAFGRAEAAEAGWQLKRVVVVMRHGIRPPTKAKALPDGFASQAWPAWDVPFGHLTHHGAKAVMQLGVLDRNTYATLLPNGCPGAHDVRFVADTDQRTLKTAEVLGQAMFPGCAVPVENAGTNEEGEGKVDIRFSPFEGETAPDLAAALKAAEASVPAGGLKGLDDANAARFARLDAILKGPAAKLGALPTTFVTSHKIKLDGAIDIGSTASQVLLLQYADGKPMNEVGWGRATRDDIRDLLSLHALEFQLVARPKAIAEFGARPLLAEVRRGLYATDTPAYTVFVGHDSNMAYLGGALGLHWQAGDFPQDDPPPGGAIIFELWRKGTQEKVMIRFRGQTMDEMRNLSPLSKSAVTTLRSGVCGQKAACPGAVLNTALEALAGS